MGLFLLSLYRARPFALAALLSATSLAPALAEDCFPRLNAADAHHIPAASPPRRPAAHAPSGHPHAGHVHHLHHRAKPHGVKRIQAKAAAARKPSHRQWLESSFARQTIPTYAPRPVSCDLHPASLLQSTPPAVAPTAAQRLLDEMVGPTPPTLAATDTQTAATTPPGGVLPPSYVPPPGVTGSIGFPGGSGTPGGPSRPPVGAVPEPATWAVMLLGFFAVGGTLRAARASKREADAAQLG